MGGPYDHGVVNVRRMQSGDISAVIAIETEAFSSPWTEEIYVQLIDQSRVELIVLEEEKAGIIGYAVLWCILDQGELANMAVSPEFRRNGLGTYLMASVLETARDRGVKTMYLEVRDSNETAVELYRRFGFSDVGLRKGYYQDPKEDARMMKVVL
jgi:ribosomal-protein-alanine N-acetyltransferase